MKARLLSLATVLGAVTAALLAGGASARGF
jgi:hypothetical protein